MTEGLSMWALRDRTQEHRGVLEKTSSKIAQMLLERRRALAEIAADARYTAEYRWERTQAEDQAARETLDAIRTEAGQAHEKMLAVAQEPPAESRSVEEQLLAEIKEQRAWDRYARALASGREPFEVVAQAAEAGDAASIRALRDELPSYLEAEGWDAPHIQAIGEQIRAAEEPFLTSDERAARKLETECREGWSRLGAAFAHAEMELGGSVTQTTELPLWEGGLLPVPEAAA